MALPTLTWTKPAAESYTNSGSAQGVKDAIAALYNIFTGGVTGWAVADYDATEAHLIIKPSDASVSNMRIAFFGGQTPDAAALDSEASSTAVSASTSSMYVLLSKDVGADTFDQSYTLGHPWATSDPDCAGAVLWGTASSAYDRMQVYACEEGVVAHDYDASSISNHVAIAGAFQTNVDDADTRNYICVGGGNSVNTTFWSATSASQELIPLGPTSGTHPRAVAYDGDTVRGAVRSTIGGSFFGTNNLKNSGGTKFYFTPVLMQADNTSYGYTLGHLRQIVAGPDGARDNIVTEGGIIKGYAVATSTSFGDVLWLVNE